MEVNFSGRHHMLQEILSSVCLVFSCLGISTHNLNNSHLQRMQQHWVSIVTEGRTKFSKAFLEKWYHSCIAGNSSAMAQPCSSCPICKMGMWCLPSNGCLKATTKLSTVWKHTSSCAWSRTNFLHPAIETKRQSKRKTHPLWEIKASPAQLDPSALLTAVNPEL